MWLAGICARRRTHFLLLRQKKVSKEKATLLSVSLRFATGNLRCSRMGCAVELTARWRASFKQPRRISSRSMGARAPMPTPCTALLGTARREGGRHGPSLRSASMGAGASRRAAPGRAGVIGVGFQLNPIDTCAAPSRSGRHAAAPAPQKLRRLPDHQPCRGKVLHVARDDAVQARVPGGFVQHGVFVVGKAGVQRVGQR